jgi:hypothetical protein
MEFNFTKLIFTLNLETDVTDPLLFFGIRKEFAEIFRRTSECGHAACEVCSTASECAYWQIFSQEISSDPSAIKRYQKPPLPFVFDLPILPPAPNKGSSLEIGLTLVGLAVNHVGHFLDTVMAIFSMGESLCSGVASLIKIESVDYLGNRSILSENGSLVGLDHLYVLSMEGLEKSVVLSNETLRITIDTPLRIIREGRPLRNLSFATLIMSLLRRMSSIGFYYCHMDLDLDFKWLSRESQLIGIVDDGYRWVEWDTNLSGIIGSATFIGNLGEFHPILLFGENFHVGKGSAYGLGCYRLEKAV